MAGVASLITRPFREMAKGGDNVVSAIVKRGAFESSSAFERVGGVLGGMAKVGLNMAAMPLYYPALAAGSVLKGSGQVIKGFAKGLGGKADDVAKTGSKLKRKKLGQAAADATGGPKLNMAGRGTDTYFNYDGVNYRQTFARDADGNIIRDANGKAQVSYGRQQDNGTYTEISGKRFGGIKNAASQQGASFYTSEDDLLASMQDDIADIAADVSETAAGDGAGVNLWQMISDHPVMATGGLLGGGMLLGELLDED